MVMVAPEQTVNASVGQEGSPRGLGCWWVKV